MSVRESVRKKIAEWSEHYRKRQMELNEIKDIERKAKHEGYKEQVVIEAKEKGREMAKEKYHPKPKKPNDESPFGNGLDVGAYFEK